MVSRSRCCPFAESEVQKSNALLMMEQLRRTEQIQQKCTVTSTGIHAYGDIGYIDIITVQIQGLNKQSFAYSDTFPKFPRVSLYVGDPLLS